ncbi:MAG: hypothetical protein J6336_02325 [Kiritimatiellae bacterium]|nr:hypothetical protein [Kiritimatiellia bacterium]
MKNLIKRHLYGKLRESHVVAPVEEPYPLNEKLSVIRLADLGGMFTR